MSVKALAGLMFPLYSAGILVLLAALSTYPWPQSPAESALTGGKTPAIAASFSDEPPDFAAITDISERKQAFFGFLRPMIQEQNRQLAQQRQKLQQLAARTEQGDLAQKDVAWITAMAEEYAVKEDEPQQIIEKLLARVNVIPEAMALAQAASESAWGTSRFAREGNNYFGQWCYSDGCGLVPSRRRKGAAHEVAAFASPYDSVKAYFHNINTHRAYSQLRQLRQQRTIEDQRLTARALLPGLTRYSERGAEYIDELRTIIRQNDLARANSKGTYE